MDLLSLLNPTQNSDQLKQLIDLMTPAEKALMMHQLKPQPEKRLLDFACHVDPMYRPELFHASLAVHLEAILNRDIDRLMIVASPQHGKSASASEIFPAFHLANKPDLPIGIASYSADLAQIKGRKVRSIVESPEFAQIFPLIKTQDDSRAVGKWDIANHRGFLKSVGRGGGLTGNGLFGVILDDIIKGAEEANSALVKEQMWAWYESDLNTRVWPGGWQIVINTRWAEDDLSGRILNSKGAGRWTILRFAAIAETQEERDRNNSKYNLPPGLPDPIDRQPGDPLCPKLRPIEFLEDIRSTVSSRVWTALYQGAPSAAEGNVIKRAWLENSIVDYVPSAEKEGVYRVRAWDLAGTDASSKNGNKADYTVGLLMTYDTNEDIFYIEDVVRGKWSKGGRNDVMEQTAKKDLASAEKVWHRTGNTYIWHELQPGAAGKDVAEEINQRLAAIVGKDYVAYQSASGSKELRFDPFVSAAEHGKIKLKRAEWNDTYIDELCDFPTGSHDDAVDASSLAFNKLILRKKKRKVKVY